MERSQLCHQAGIAMEQAEKMYGWAEKVARFAEKGDTLLGKMSLVDTGTQKVDGVLSDLSYLILRDELLKEEVEKMRDFEKRFNVFRFEVKKETDDARTLEMIESNSAIFEELNERCSWLYKALSLLGTMMVEEALETLKEMPKHQEWRS